MNVDKHYLQTQRSKIFLFLLGAPTAREARRVPETSFPKENIV